MTRPSLPSLRVLRPAPSIHHPKQPMSKAPTKATPKKTSDIIGKPKRLCLPAGKACNHCRKRKTACDGAQPICGSCAKKALDCQYLTINGELLTQSKIRLAQEVKLLRQRETVFEGFLVTLRDAPQSQVEDILSQLRTSSNLFNVLQTIDNNSLLELQPLQPLARWTSTGGFTSSLDERLVQSCPTIFVPPEDMANSLEILSALSDNDTTEHQPVVLLPMGFTRTLSSTTSEYSAVMSSTARLQPGLSISDLGTLQISNWTSVAISNQFAAHCIMSFLRTDHSILGLFDPLDFVQSLLNGRHEPDLCILVNAMLAFASIHTPEDPGILALSFELELEAERLWLANRSSVTADSIAGCVLMLLSFYCHDKWLEAKSYLSELCQIIKQQKLFGAVEEMNEKVKLGSMSDHQQKAIAYLAWGVFNFLNMEALLYLAEPPQSPPRIGFDSISTNAGNFISRVFCGFWTIVNRILLVYRSSVERVPSLSFALSQFQALLAFAEGLPEEMEANDGSSSAILVFHIWFHIVVLDLFRPFVSDSNSRQWLELFNDEKTTSADAISAASIRQLKRLVTIYQIHHEKSTPTLFWHVALLYIANFVIKDAQALDRRSWLLICTRAYSRLGRYWIFCDRVLNGLLGMAVEFEAIDLAEAKAEAQFCNCGAVDFEPHKEFCHNRTERPLSDWSPQSFATTAGVRAAIPKPVVLDGQNSLQRDITFILDLDKGLQDRQSSRMDAMARRFQEMTMFDDLTFGII